MQEFSQTVKAGEAGAGADRGRGISPDEQRRMTSITRKLHWYGIRRRLVRFFCTDVFLFAALAVLWCADQEYTALGRIILNNRREFAASQ